LTGRITDRCSGQADALDDGARVRFDSHPAPLLYVPAGGVDQAIAIRDAVRPSAHPPQTLGTTSWVPPGCEKRFAHTNPCTGSAVGR
jgi:hypothetical protein